MHATITGKRAAYAAHLADIVLLDAHLRRMHRKRIICRCCCTKVDATVRCLLNSIRHTAQG
jgi:hypothetical protein